MERQIICVEPKDAEGNPETIAFNLMREKLGFICIYYSCIENSELIRYNKKML